VIQVDRLESPAVASHPLRLPKPVARADNALGSRRGDRSTFSRAALRGLGDLCGERFFNVPYTAEVTSDG